MSLSNFLNIGSYGNMFTSGCFGSCGYNDTMTGFQVANAAMGAVGSIFSAIMSNKQQQKAETPSTEDQIAKIDEQITNAKKCQSEYNTKLSTLQEELSALTTTAGDPQKINEKKVEIATIESILKNLKEKIESYEKQKAELQEDANDQILDQADGANWKKTSQEDFDKKWNADGTPKEGEEFTKGDMRYAIAMFRNAQTDTDKKKWANTIDTIYQDFMNNNMKNITSDFKAARKIVDKYVD